MAGYWNTQWTNRTQAKQRDKNVVPISLQRPVSTTAQRMMSDGLCVHVIDAWRSNADEWMDIVSQMSKFEFDNEYANDIMFTI